MKPTAAVSVLLSLLSFTACDEIISILHRGGQSVPIRSYPLQLGNRWSYTRHFRSYNFRPLIPGALDPRINVTTRYDVDINAVRRIPRQPNGATDSIEVREVRNKDWQSPNPPAITYSYMKQESNGLYMHGYSGGTIGSPESYRISALRYRFSGHTFSSLQHLMDFVQCLTQTDNPDTLGNIHRSSPSRTHYKTALIGHSVREGDHGE